LLHKGNKTIWMFYEKFDDEGNVTPPSKLGSKQTKQKTNQNKQANTNTTEIK